MNENETHRLLERAAVRDRDIDLGIVSDWAAVDLETEKLLERFENERSE